MWNRIEFKDKLTGEVVGVEVEPVYDIRPHVSDPSCGCIPLYEEEEDGVLRLIHNSFDGRELSELSYNHERGH